jgi:hypothetical protein
MFSYVYILVDTVDESKGRPQFLEYFLYIHDYDDLRYIQILVISRKELDIKRLLLPIVQDLLFSNPYVDKNIGIYMPESLPPGCILEENETMTTAVQIAASNRTRAMLYILFTS